MANSLAPLLVAHAVYVSLATATLDRETCRHGHSPAEAKTHSLLQSAFGLGARADVNESSLDGRGANSRAHNASAGPAQGGEVSMIHFGSRSIPTGLLLLLVFFLITALGVYLCYRFEKSADDAVTRAFLSRDRQGKVYSYNNENLLTWRIFATRVPAIILSWRVWATMPCVLGVAVVSGLLPVVAFGHPIDFSELQTLEKYFKVFIAFMLVMFMNTALARWNASVSNFTGLLTVVKQALWTVRFMGMKQELVDELERKLVLACYIIDAELHTDLGSNAVEWQSHWDSRFAYLRQRGLLQEKEEKKLRSKQQKVSRDLEIDMGIYSAMVWTWIARIVSDIREEPGVLVPMYVRLVSLIHTCLGNVDKLKTTVQIQIPFSYVYIFSMIVHLNNVMLAMCSGLEISTSLMQIGVTAEKLEQAPNLSVYRKLFNAMQIVWFQTILLLCQPLLYQACLVISHMLSHPFGDHSFHLPTETFLMLMQDEMKISAISFKSHQERTQAKKFSDTKRHRDHEDHSNSSSGGGSGVDLDDFDQDGHDGEMDDSF